MTVQPLVSISSVDLIYSAASGGDAQKINTNTNAESEIALSSHRSDSNLDSETHNNSEKDEMEYTQDLKDKYDLSSPSLFIGNLDRSITEADLHKVFCAIGPFFSIKVCEPKTNESSRGYAYVNYINPEDAIKAIQLLDNQPVFSNEIDRRLHDPTLRIQVRPARRKEFRIFFKNLDNSLIDQTETINNDGNYCQSNNLHQYTGNQRFLDLFSPYGVINEHKIFIQQSKSTTPVPSPPLTASTSTPANIDLTTDLIATKLERPNVGFGYIDYDTKESANAAVYGLNGQRVGNFTLNVGFQKFRPNHHSNCNYRGSKAMSSTSTGDGNDFDDDTHNTNIFVKGFSEDLTQDEFKDIFSKQGHYKIINVSFPTNAQTKTSTGYGFLKLISNEQCRELIQEFNGKDILLDGRCILVRFSKNRHSAHNNHSSHHNQQYHPHNNLHYSSNQHTHYNHGFENNSTLYVKNLDSSVSESDLLETFEPFGNVVSHKIMVDEEGHSRGFGFIKFQNYNSSLAAIHGLNNFVLKSRRMLVSAAQRNGNNGNNRPRSHLDNHQGIEAGYYENRSHGPSNNHRPNRGYVQRQHFSSMKKYSRNQCYQRYETSSLAAVIASAPDQLVQREIMGEEIYPKVLSHARIAGNSTLASEITGVILELPINDLLSWIDDEHRMSEVILQAHDAFLKYQTEVRL